MQTLRQKTILIEGNICSGKSSLIKYIENNPDHISSLIETIYEPVNLWRDLRGENLFKLFSQNPKKYAFPFQSYVQKTMFTSHMKTLNPSKQFKIMERSIYSARYCFCENLYENGLLDKCEMSIIDSWFQYLTQNFIRPPNLIVYLEASPEVLVNRIRVRGRPEEQFIDLHYLFKIGEKYDSFLKSNIFGIIPIIRINTNVPECQISKEYELGFKAIKNSLLDTQ